MPFFVRSVILLALLLIALQLGFVLCLYVILTCAVAILFFVRFVIVLALVLIVVQLGFVIRVNVSYVR